MNQQPNLLIVDDIPENLFLLETVLKKVKVNLIKASNGIEALEKTKGMELALAIVDVRMPLMDGYELARKINESRPESKVPIIFLTANYDRDAVEGYESGAVDYIYKPLQSRILLSKVNVFLDLYHQKQKILLSTELLQKSSEDLKRSLEQLHSLANYSEKAREYERKSIARELHDDLGQALTAVKIDLSIVKQKIADAELVLKIDKVTSLVSQTIKTVQRLTAQLRPEIIDDLGLEAAINWYTKEFGERNAIDMLLDVDKNIPVSNDDSITLFRVLQESLTNVARHAKATQVEVSLHLEEGMVKLRISDNGKGISEEERNSKKAFGLIGMRERATTLSGNFDIIGRPGEGTVICLDFPCMAPFEKTRHER